MCRWESPTQFLIFIPYPWQLTVLLPVFLIKGDEPALEIEADDNSNKKAKGVLTKRQTQILRLIAQGKTSREIADELFIGVRTVETHRKNMIRILGLRGKGELMRYALEKKYKF